MDLSVVIPAYNAERFIKEAVQSALRQEFPAGFSWEVIVVDDGSTDATQRVVRTMIETESKLSLVVHGENRGGAAARNTGVQSASSSVIRIADADNVIPPGLLAREFEYLATIAGSAVSVAALVFIDPAGLATGDVWLMDMGSTFSADDLFTTNMHPPAHGNYMFERKVFDEAGGYDETSDAMDTWVFGARHLLAGHAVSYLPCSYYLHRIGLDDSYWTRGSVSGANARAVFRFAYVNKARLGQTITTRMELVRKEAPNALFELIEEGVFRDSVSDSAAEEMVRRKSRWLKRATVVTTLRSLGVRR